MRRSRRSDEQPSILEVFVDPLFGAFGAFLFIFLVVIVIMGIRLVASDPVILTAELPPAYNAIEYNLALSANEGLGCYHWSLFEGNLPKGMSITEDGMLTGRPLVSYGGEDKVVYEFTVQVDSTERAGDTQPAFCSYTLTLFRDIPVNTIEISPVLIMTEAELPVMPDQTPYTLSLAAIGGIAPYRWTLVAGALPPGMTLNRNGVLHGTPVPEEYGIFEFSLEVRDVRIQGTPGASQRKDFHVEIVPVFPAPIPLAILSTEIPDGIKDQPYLSALSAEGGSPPYAWSVSGMPSGVSLDEETNTLKGSPGVSGFYEVSITVVDSAGESVSLPNPVRIQIRVGQIVQWWKVLAFLILYLTYLFLCWTWHSSAVAITKKIQRKCGVVITVHEDGRVSAQGPEKAIDAMNSSGGLIRMCIGQEQDIAVLWFALTFRLKKALSEITVFRLALIFAGYSMFFYISRGIQVTWALIVSAILLVLALLFLIGAWAYGSVECD